MCEVIAIAPVVDATPASLDLKQIEARLKEKGLTRRMGCFILPEEAQFIRYTTTIERLRMACFQAQKECQDARVQLARAKSAEVGAVKARMQARSAMSYSVSWRESWNARRAANHASDGKSREIRPAGGFLLMSVDILADQYNRQTLPNH